MDFGKSMNVFSNLEMQQVPEKNAAVN